MYKTCTYIPILHKITSKFSNKQIKIFNKLFLYKFNIIQSYIFYIPSIQQHLCNKIHNLSSII